MFFIINVVRYENVENATVFFEFFTLFFLIDASWRDKFLLPQFGEVKIYIFCTIYKLIRGIIY